MASSTIPNSNSSSSTGTVGKGSQITTGTIDFNSVTRRGNIVTACGRIHSMTNQDGGTHVWFVIPEGFRPYYKLHANAYMSISEIGFVPVLCTIYTNGNVEMFFSNRNSCDQVGFSATYAI